MANGVSPCGPHNEAAILASILDQATAQTELLQAISDKLDDQKTILEAIEANTGAP